MPLETGWYGSPDRKQREQRIFECRQFASMRSIHVLCSRNSLDGRYGIYRIHTDQ